MIKDNFPSITKFLKNLLLIIIVLMPAPLLLAQLPVKVEKALEEYYSEIVTLSPQAIYCYLWLLNYESNGKSYFDRILFVKILDNRPQSP